MLYLFFLFLVLLLTNKTVEQKRWNKMKRRETLVLVVEGKGNWMGSVKEGDLNNGASWNQNIANSIQ